MSHELTSSFDFSSCDQLYITAVRQHLSINWWKYLFQYWLSFRNSI